MATEWSEDFKARVSLFERRTIEGFRRGVVVGQRLERERLLTVLRGLQEGQSSQVVKFLDEVLERVSA